jgi:hypothetical protein
LNHSKHAIEIEDIEARVAELEQRAELLLEGVNG